MVDYKQEIEIILSELKNRISNDRKQIKKLPKGRLVQVQQHGRVYLSKTEYRKGVRIRRSLGNDSEYIGLLLRASYLKNEIETLENDYKALRLCLSELKGFDRSLAIYSMQKKYTKLDKGFIVDALSDKEDDDWAAEPYEVFHGMDDGKKHVTSKGLYVRSKSEALIAEMLYENNIAFRYEQVLHISGLQFVPDFTVRRADGKIFYWEHEGLMNDYEYRQRQYSKLRTYFENNIGLWDNLILTFDTENGYINIKEIDFIIQNKLKV